ncbi:2OG-Fe(II) oxygenase [Rhodopila globiformis]|uniref:Proline hydroxylase n=1 Tax=Rhodopila globiformis TaxID=1071 RepID=A0A2S6NLD3_RHOGL|nr:2OG-Fe(II) oxygenase [Rhodopila globiformis]PPQ35970.1 proline hydroxylase [Rhodopila globiformis]
MHDLTLHPEADDRPIADRLDALDWPGIGAALDADGYVVIGPLLTVAECAGLSAGFDTDAAFRNRVVMARHGYGQGEYRYYSYPLPPLIEGLRTALYPRLAEVANRWERALGRPPAFPPDHAAYRARCHAAGQTRPTPLLLRYGPGDYNRLHQDLYGDLCFPLQVAFLLNRPGEDFTGGEFLLTEQRPRMQVRAEVVPLTRGQGVIFAVNQRPAQGTRGAFRVAMRHGVSRIRSGQRHTLGVIFHDAK